MSEDRESSLDGETADPFTDLGPVTELTGRTWQGSKDDGSETSGNDKYHTD